MKPSVFLDTNVLIRHLLQDDSAQSPKASAFLKTIEDGIIAVATSDTVIFETVFLLERHYRRGREQIRDALLPIIYLPGIVLARKSSLAKVFDLYIELNIPFADAHHAVQMERMAIRQIASFDEDFDKIPGVTRLRL